VPLHEWQTTEKEPLIDIITWVFEEGTFVPAARIKGDNSQSIITDYLGTPTTMYDAKGEKTWEANLDIYGKVRTFAGRSLSDCPFRYQGQYQDEETGLYYNRFRYYDPTIGSYISQDPIGLEGNNPTLYEYVKDNNVWIDPLGLTGNNLPEGVQVVKDVENPRKTVLLGENMDQRVKPLAKENGYDVFKPRGKNPDNWMRNQQQWIRRQLKDPTVRILDYGPDPNRAIRSKYYLEEMKYVKKYAGYERKNISGCH
jgi:RHS repeat-associated protein